MDHGKKRMSSVWQEDPLTNMVGPMNNTVSLPRHALFCLRWSNLCSDPSLAQYMSCKAAEALRAEFDVELDPNEHCRVPGRQARQ
jgi:hypothetical protein